MDTCNLKSGNRVHTELELEILYKYYKTVYTARIAYQNKSLAMLMRF